MNERFVIAFPVSAERHVEVRADWPLKPAEWNRMWTLLEDMRVDLVEQFTWEGPTSPAVGTPAVVEQQANDTAAGLPPRPEPAPVEPEAEAPDNGDALTAAVAAPKRTNRRQQKKAEDES